jgi:CRP-like cAMP-binding protein
VDIVSLLGFLQSTSLFGELDEVIVRKLLLASLVRQFSARAEILKEGAPGGALHLVHRGEVRISKLVPSGGEEALAVVGPGDFFGEVEFFDDGPSSAPAIAHTDCELISIPHRDLRSLMETRPELGERLLWAFAKSFARRLRETNERLAGLLSISREF